MSIWQVSRCRYHLCLCIDLDTNKTFPGGFLAEGLNSSLVSFEWKPKPQWLFTAFDRYLVGQALTFVSRFWDPSLFTDPTSRLVDERDAAARKCGVANGAQTLIHMIGITRVSCMLLVCNACCELHRQISASSCRNLSSFIAASNQSLPVYLGLKHLAHQLL